MEEIAQKVILIQTEREDASLLPPKRPRTGCMMTNHHIGKSSFEFPELSTFLKIQDSNILPKNTGRTYTAELGCEGTQHKNDQNESAKTDDATSTWVTMSHTDDNKHEDSSRGFFTAGERHSSYLGTDEALPVIETDKLSSHPGDDTGGVSAEPHTSNDTSANTSTFHDCKQLGKSLEYQLPGDGSHPSFPLTGYDEGRGPIQIGASHIQPIPAGTSEHGEGKCQSDRAHENDTRCQFYEGNGSNQKGDEHEYSQNILMKEVEVARSQTAPSDHGGFKLSCFHCETSPSENHAGGEESRRKDAAVWMRDIEHSELFCSGETKGRVEENSKRDNNSNPGAAAQGVESAQGSTITCDTILAANVMYKGIETGMSLELDDPSGVEAGQALGMMTAEAASKMADHTTEIQMPAKISQEPAEGDNDTGSFIIIDPAIQSETDREAEEKCAESEQDAGVQLSPSVRVSSMQTPLSEPSKVGPSEYDTKELLASDQTSHSSGSSRTEQCRGKKQEMDQSSAILQCFSANKNVNERLCHWKSCPSRSPCQPAECFPIGEEGKEIHRTVGHPGEQGDPSGFSPISPDHLKAACSKTEIAAVHGLTETKEEKPGNSEGEMRAVMFDSVKPEELLTQESQQHIAELTEISTECIIDCTEGNVTECGHISTLSFKDECANEGSLLCSPSVGIHSTETFMVIECDEGPPSSFTGFPTSDAVVPGPQDSVPQLHSQNADNSSTQHCNNDVSGSLPSVLVFSDLVPMGFDTFEKIQLSPDDNAEGLGCSPLLTSSPSQQLKTCQQWIHHFIPEAKSDNQRGVSVKMQEKEEVNGEERNECPGRKIGNGDFDYSDRSCEASASIPTLHISAIAKPGQQLSIQSGHTIVDPPKCDLNYDLQQSTASIEESNRVSEVNGYPRFEMKEQFDMVLEELKLFFDITVSEVRVSSPEQCCVTAKPEKACTSGSSERSSSPSEEQHRRTSSGHANDDNDLSVENGADPGVSCATKGYDHEQVVPLDCSYNCQEGDNSMYSSGKHRGQRDSPRRLEPLRTCTRPIRVGLSKRAKTKHLHVPYLRK